jgi:hypothetical protein
MPEVEVMATPTEPERRPPNNRRLEYDERLTRPDIRDLRRDAKRRARSSNRPVELEQEESAKSRGFGGWPELRRAAERRAEKYKALDTAIQNSDVSNVQRLCRDDVACIVDSACTADVEELIWLLVAIAPVWPEREGWSTRSLHELQEWGFEDEAAKLDECSPQTDLLDHILEGILSRPMRPYLFQRAWIVFALGVFTMTARQLAFTALKSLPAIGGEEAREDLQDFLAAVDDVDNDENDDGGDFPDPFGDPLDVLDLLDSGASIEDVTGRQE